MKTRKMGIGLAAVLVLIVALSFYARNRTKSKLDSSGQAPDYPLNGTIASSGEKREYVLYVPGSYDPAKPSPLIITLHGAAVGPTAQMGISRWNRVADKHCFIVVYPSGLTSGVGLAGGTLPVWPMEPEAILKADVTFISELIDKLEAAYNIDPARIYVNGFSNGGGMAFALSCALSHRIAAVGTVAACSITALELVCRPPPNADDHVPRNCRSIHAVQRRFVAYRPRNLSERLDMGGELGEKKPVRTKPRRIGGRCGCHAPRIHELR